MHIFAFRAGATSPAIAPSLHRLGEPIVSSYLVADDSGVTIIDAGLPGYWGDLPVMRRLLRLGLAAEHLASRLHDRRRSLRPVAGCWYYNHRSRRTLQRAGMYSSTRLLKAMRVPSGDQTAPPPEVRPARFPMRSLGFTPATR